MKKISSLSVSFTLNSKRFIDGNPTIYCKITVDGQVTQISLQRSIQKEQWHDGKVISKTQEAKALDNYIALFKTNIRTHFDTLLSLGATITAETLKNSILGVVDEEARKKCFLEMAAKMNKEFQDKVEKGKRSVNTLKKHKISQNFFMQFLKEEKKINDVVLEKLNISHCYDFEHYLSIKKDHSHNTYMKHIKNVKQVLTFAVKKMQMDKNPFDAFQFSYIEPKITLLEQHEIDTMWHHPMPIKRLEQVRDRYIFCCYTAYAFTDVGSLTTDNIIMSLDKEFWICKDRTKTDTAENIMLLPIAKQIIEKYNDHPCRKNAGFLLPQISLQNYNGYLKEIATICGINKDLTSHTARFTFATTITLENDVPIESVSKMMGHKSIRTTQRYAKVTKRKLTNNMQELRTKLEIVQNNEEQKRDVV